MISCLRRRFRGIMAVMALCSLTGVEARAEVDVNAVRGSLLLAEEPAGAVTLAAAKAKLTSCV